MNQVNFGNYDPEYFNSLPLVEAAHVSLRGCKDNLALFGDLFRKHQVNDIVSLTLLHRHFEMSETELLIEESVGDNDEIEVSPKEISASDAVPYMWRVKKLSDKNSYTLVPIEFYHANAPVSPEAKNLYDALLEKQDFIDEFVNLLADTKTENVFGLCLLHRDVLLLNRELVHFEETDKPARISHMTTIRVSDVDTSSSVQTHWRFGPKGSGDEIVVCSQCDAGTILDDGTVLEGC